MSVIHNQLNGSNDNSGKWFLRKSGSDVFGPEELSAIARWVEESRVVSGNEISQDKETWITVENIPEFQMDWIAELADGRKYGPFNIKAADDLHKHKVLPADAVLVNRHSKDSTTVEDYLEGQLKLKNIQNEPENSELETPAETETEETAEETEPVDEKETAPVEKKRKRSPKTTSETAETTGDETTADSDADESPTAVQEKKEGEEAYTSPEPDDVAKLNAELQISKKLAEDLAAKLTTLESVNTEQLKDLQKAQTELDKVSKKLAVLEETSASRQAEEQETQRKIAEKFENELKQREEKVSELDRLKKETAEKAADAEERLATAVAELKKARKAGETAQSHLKEVEAQQARKQSVQQKRLSDLLEERNHLAQIVEMQSRRTSRLKFAVAVLILLLLASVITLIVKRSNGDSNTASEKQVEEQLREVEDQNLDEVKSDEPATRRTSAPFPIVKAQGIEVFYNKSGCNIAFKNAFFSSGTTPSPAALEIIKKISPQLKSYSKQYHLIVEGHTDDKPLGSRSKYKSNYELGLARAKVVADLLTKNHGFSNSDVKATSAGSEDPPFPNDNDASRQKNRTVVLKLVRHVRI